MKPDSEVKDLTLVMGLFLKIAERSNDVSDVLLLDNEEQQQWPHFIVALAKEKGLDMAATCLADIGDAVKEWEDGDELPPAKADRFGFKSAVSISPFVPSSKPPPLTLPPSLSLLPTTTYVNVKRPKLTILLVP